MTTQSQPPRFPKRRRPAHAVFSTPDRPIIIFLTACTRQRAPWLATPDIHRALVKAWSESSGWLVGRYVIMPDHIHLFATPDGRYSLERWVRYWKATVSREHGNPAWRWQPGHWDRQLRAGESYLSKWEYVVNNPVRHRLVQNAEHWPYQGVIHELPW